MIKNAFTAEEDSFIIGNCKKMNYAEIAIYLGRPSENSIHQRVGILEKQGRLKRFGLVRDGTFHPFYSDEEDEIIKRLYPSLGKKALARKMKRPESSVRYRASKLDVKSGQPNHLNPPRIARLLGVCQRIVNDWIYQGFLKADNRNGRRVGRHREWIIKPQDFHKFLRDYYYLYDPNRVRDKFLLSIIALTPAGKVVTTSQAAKILGIVRSAVIKRAIKGDFPVAYKGFGPSGHTRWYLQLDDCPQNLPASQIRYQVDDLVINQNFQDSTVYRKVGKVVAANQGEIRVDFGEGMCASRICRVYEKGFNLNHIAPYRKPTIRQKL